MISDLKKDCEKKMDKTVAALREEFQNIRAGRANPSLVERLSIDYYGVKTPLSQAAGISAPEPRLLVIQPWDKNLIPEIEKAIQRSDLGINPSNDGKVIRLAIPQLTEERRKELTKVVRKNSENSKVSIRNIRRDAMEEIKKAEKNNEITEDDKDKNEDSIQKLTDEYIKKIEDLTKSKEDELMEI